ncbi:DUF5979 domain-containing protein [Nocardioides sp. CCNWLW239]|uniref:DUF5979 domain-containing protein n=1 Tax=Nocardioides sp. CCNWLW239 TaxID=3128902 RepID=UPI003017B0DB
MFHRRLSEFFGIRYWLASLLAGLLAVGLVSAPALADELPNPENPTAVLDITKSVDSPGPYGPGDTIVYTIQVGCSAIDVGVDCNDAITTDVIPEPLVVQQVTPSGPNSSAEPVVDGQNVRVDWTEPLDAGGEGMVNNTTSQVQITVQVPEDLNHDQWDGATLTNEATAEATNAADKTDSVDVTLAIPLELATSATKSFDPTSALAAEGTPVTANLGGTNETNGAVETLVIQDPTDPTATPNPFTYLGFTGFGTVTPPEGATGTTYEVYVGGAWVECADATCPGVDPAAVEGTRVTFTGDIPAGATADVDLNLETTEEAAGVSEDTVVNNQIQTAVTRDGENATANAEADFTLRANTIEVGATKSFDPDIVIAGESSTVTIGGSNDSAIPIDTLTITEPSTGSFPEDYTFGGFTGGIPYPAGATSGTVVYQPSGEEVPFIDGGTPLPPTGGAESVTSFEIVFEGDIEPGAETSIPFEVDTDPEATDLPKTVNNQVAVEGENDGATGNATADDDLYIYNEVIEPYIDKQIRPSQILAYPGNVVTVSLQGGTTERPNPPETPTGTTGDASQIVIQDPMDPVEGNVWWNAFDLDTIAQTPIPADATLTVEYYNTATGEWETLVGPEAGPQIFSYDVPDDISDVAGGVRFVYDYTGDGDGFAPGTDLEPNFTATLRPQDDGRYTDPAYDEPTDANHTFIPNCAQSGATASTDGVPSGETQMDPEDCPEVELIPTDPGTADLMNKEFGQSSSGGDKTVFERSGDTIPSTLHWSTGGYSGFETVELTDIDDPENTAVADSVYDAFNLIRIQPITPETDPYLVYDQITDVQLWDGTSWSSATNNPCPDACDGTFPGMDLTADEQESTLAVKLIYAESPNRAERIEGNLDAPPVGSGVARSIDGERAVTLVWQIRDTQRSDGSPALAVDTYNRPDAGVVRNTANATGFPADGDPVTDTDFDDVVINDAPITTTTDKTWEGGPISVPGPGTPQEDYPLSRMTVTTENTTPAKVDQLQITDPAPGSTTEQDPFDYFRLYEISSITEPEGTENTTVTLTCPDGSTNEYTRDEALALTLDTMPCDVSGVQVLFDGRIASAGTGVLALDMQIRRENRTTGEPITPEDSPVANTAQGIVADVDPIQPCPPEPGDRFACAQDTATIEIADATYDIEATKTIEPASQKEGDNSPVTVTIGSQSSGSARPYIESQQDDDPTFWNAMDFVQMDPSWTLPTPVEHVQACYLTGGTFTAATVETGLAGDDGGVGGTWTCQEIPGGGPPFEDDELTLQQAKDFIAAAPAGEIHGLRFQFMAGSEDGWVNPTHPNIQVPFQVVRRDELRSGGPVPSTRSDQEAAPGETEAGVFTDTVDVHGTTVLIGLNNRLEADDSADATYTYEHLTVGVEVDKTPTGQVQPGEVIPFTLTYTNTGEHALTNPVFTDVLPSDADGNQLIFDPDAAPGSSPYSFELAGAAPEPPNGDPLPTDEDEITITEDGDTITFAMPEGSVLEPGQTYTITIELMLRPGLTPDDVVTNTDKVIADEPFDPENCSPNYDAETGECWDESSVSPVRVAALSTQKLVKADVPVEEEGIPEIYLDRRALPEGSDLPDDYCDDQADEDGFYRGACVPVTYPGDTETWRYTITNSGTLPLDELVSIDVLPHVGDNGVIVDLPRNSEWTPTWANQLELVDDGGNSATMQVFYANTYEPCTDDLSPLDGDPCPEGEWLPYDDSVDPAEVKSIKTVVTFDEATLFNPGEMVTLQGKTRTTPQNAAQVGYPVAWNTVATGGVSNDNGERATVLPTEGRKVGVTYPTGPIQLEKIVSGEGAEYAPDTFTVNLTCTVPGQSEPMDLSGVNPITLTPGADPVQVDGLPWGSECTATEADQGQYDQTIGTATVGGPEDEIGLITVENEFTLGDLEVTKEVTSDAVDADGDPLTYGPFSVRVICRYDGRVVRALPIQIEDGQTIEVEDLPTGAVCTITETDDAGAAQVNITPDEDPDTPGAQVTIGSREDPDSNPIEVEVENVYETGSLRLLKEVTGDALENDPALADGPFTFQVTCRLTDPTRPDGEVVYDQSITLPDDDNVDNDQMDYQVDDLPSGADCVIEETDDGGATGHTVDPDQVTIGTDPAEPAQVTATNTFLTGGMAVTKQVETDAVDQDGNPISYDGPFEMTVTCTYQGRDVWGDGFDSSPMTQSIDDGETWAISGLPVGAECVTEESGTADAVETSISPEEPVIIGQADEPTQVVTVTNSYDVGSLELVKESTGDALDNNPQLADGPFRFRITCVLTDASHPDGEEVYDNRVVLPRDDNVDNDQMDYVIENLPTNAVCDVTETGDGGATSHTIDGSPATIGDDNAEPVTVTATNTFATGALAVTKSVTSDAVDQDGNPITYGPFEIATSCTFNGRPVVADGYEENPMTETIEDGETVTFEGLPTGSQCTVTEPDSADAAVVTISPEQPVTVGEGDVVEVEVDNSFDVGSLRLRKFVPEQVRDYPISQGPFTFAVTCTLTDATRPDGEVVFEDDEIVLPDEDNVDNDVIDYRIDNIAAGAECTVEETDDGAANAHIVTPKTVTISADENHEPTVKRVVVTNFFGAGKAVVTKKMEGSGAELYGAGPFEVTVKCTYTDVNGDEQPLETPGGETRELSADNDYTATYEPLLIGSHCTIEETQTGGANSTVITDADGNEVSEFTVKPVPNREELTVEPVELTVTNTFDTGSVKVVKTVNGPGEGPFEVELACTYDVDGTATDVDIPGGATRTLKKGSMTATYEDLPRGAECTLEETDDGGARSTTITPNAGDPTVGVVTVGNGADVTLDVVNDFPPSGPSGDGDDSSSGLLPDTGSGPWLMVAALIGLALLLSGGVFLIAGRKRRHEGS